MARPSLFSTLLDSRISSLPRLFLLTAFGLGLVLARVVTTGSLSYTFLAWNLFLAWVPFALAKGLEAAVEKRVHGAWVLAVGSAWLLFLPNAPYLATDLMHLRYREGAPLWFDAIMLMTFGWAGLVLGVESLSMVAKLVANRVGIFGARLFVIGVALLTGYGIYLGRFVRLNSWDVAAHPGWVLRQVATPVVHPLDTIRAWNVTVTVAGLFLLTYLTMRRPEPLPVTPPSTPPTE